MLKAEQRASRSKHPRIDALTAENVEAILNDELKTRAQTPPMYRAVGAIASYCGKVAFLLSNIVFFAIWITLNQTVWKYDPFPFPLLVISLAIESIVLSILILIGQNMATAESERRHHLNLQINLLNERELTALLRLSADIAAAVGVTEKKLAEIREFAHDTDPAAVLKQIKEAEAKKAGRGALDESTHAAANT